MKYGIRSVSMDDLSSQLGISKKTLYQFCSKKEDLVDKVISHHVNLEKDALNDINHRAVDALDAMVQIAQYVVISFRDIKPGVVYDLQKYYPKSYEKLRRFHSEFIREEIRKNLQRGIKENLYRTGLDPIVISTLYESKAWILVDLNLFPASEFNAEHLLKQHILYHIHGILSENGTKRLKDFKLFN